VNCRTHEHRHFERTLRVSDSIRYPHLAEGRITMTSYGRCRLLQSRKRARFPSILRGRGLGTQVARASVRTDVSLGASRRRCFDEETVKPSLLRIATAYASHLKSRKRFG
jgi:hypothetical protein